MLDAAWPRWVLIERGDGGLTAASPEPCCVADPHHRLPPHGPSYKSRPPRLRPGGGRADGGGAGVPGAAQDNGDMVEERISFDSWTSPTYTLLRENITAHIELVATLMCHQCFREIQRVETYHEQHRRQLHIRKLQTICAPRDPTHTPPCTMYIMHGNIKTQRKQTKLNKNATACCRAIAAPFMSANVLASFFGFHCPAFLVRENVTIGEYKTGKKSVVLLLFFSRFMTTRTYCYRMLCSLPLSPPSHKTDIKNAN